MDRFHTFKPECSCIAILLFAFAAQALAQTAVTRVVGTVKSVSGNSAVVTLDNGTESTITFADSARITRAMPGQTDLKSAPTIQVSEIQAGDRIAAKAQPGDNNALVVSSALVMSKGDIAQNHQHERDEWRGAVGEIVKEVNATAGTVTIPNPLAGAGKQIVIHVSAQTQILRYPPDSVRFEDAKPSTFDQIKVGYQVLARGTRSADGNDFDAKSIVFGSFREIAATVVSTDAPSNSATVTDLATKKAITIKIGSDSMLRKLPQMMAMGIAMRLKGISMPGGASAAAASGTGSRDAGGNRASGGWQGGPGQGGGGQGWQRGPNSSAGAGGSGAPGGGFGGFRGGNGPSDFQQMLARMPAMPLTDLKKGDAVILLLTAGSAESTPTAIKLVAGVEPILEAAPPGMNAAATVLSPWNLGTGGGGGGDAAVGQ